MAPALSTLLEDAGAAPRASPRDLRPVLALAGFEVKQLKPRDVVGLLAAGTRDLGFAGADWVRELGADVELLLDTGLDPVRVVAAAPRAILDAGPLEGRSLRIATEFVSLAQEWAQSRGIVPTIVRTSGATEVFPPEDADLIVDVVQTGATLEANGLEEVETLLCSTTRLYASRALGSNPARRARAQDLALLLSSVLEARGRVLLELNVSKEALEGVVALLPAMRRATLAPLHGEAGFAVKAAVARSALGELLPALVARGASDLIVCQLERVLR